MLKSYPVAKVLCSTIYFLYKITKGPSQLVDLCSSFGCIKGPLPVYYFFSLKFFVRRGLAHKKEFTKQGKLRTDRDPGY
jgi:hypothetical protein